MSNLNRPSCFDEYYGLSYDFEQVTQLDIRPSIDYIKVSIHFGHLSSLSLIPFLLNNKFQINFTNKKNELEYIHAKKILYDKQYKLVVTIMPDIFTTTFKLINPDIYFIRYMNNIFMNYHYVVSEVEYSLDLYGFDNGRLFSFLASHAYLKYPGKTFDDIHDTTQYLNDIRGTRTYGSKIYIKYNAFVRIEMTVKRNALYSKNLHPRYSKIQINPLYISDLLKIKLSDIFRKLKFKVINLDVILKDKKINNYSENIEEIVFNTMNSKKNCGGFVGVKSFLKSIKGSDQNLYTKHKFQDVFLATLEYLNCYE